METWDSFNGISEEEKKKRQTANQSGAQALKESKNETWETFNATAPKQSSSSAKVTIPFQGPTVKINGKDVKLYDTSKFEGETIKPKTEEAAKVVQVAGKNYAVRTDTGKKVWDAISILPDFAKNALGIKEYGAEKSVEENIKELGEEQLKYQQEQGTMLDNDNRAARNVSVGMAGVVSSLARAGEWLAPESMETPFKEVADQTDRWIEATSPKGPKFVDNLLQGVGSAASFFVPGVGVAKSSTLIARFSPKIALLFGSTVSSGLESMAEAGSVYKDVLDTSGDKDMAGDAASRTAIANMALIMLTNKFGAFSDAAQSRIRRAVLSAPVEGVQEFAQQIISNVNTGKDPYEGAVESGVIGTILGVPMGYMGGGGDLQDKESIEVYLENTDTKLPTNDPKKDNEPENVVAIKGFDIDPNMRISQMRDQIPSLQAEMQNETNFDVIDQKSAQITALKEQIDKYVELNRETVLEAENNDISVKIDTVKFDDGKYGVSYETSSEGNNLSVPFIVNELFGSQEEAVDYAKQGIMDWTIQNGIDVQTSKILEEETAKLEKMKEAVKEKQVNLENELKNKKATSKEMVEGDEGAQEIIMMNEAEKENDKLKLTAKFKGIKNAIRNSPYFKKEGDVNDEWISAPIYKKGDVYRFATNEEEKIKLINKGYEYHNSIDGMAEEAGIDAEEFLERAFDETMGARQTSAGKAAHKYMMENSEEYAKLQEEIDQISNQIKKLKITYANIEKTIKGENEKSSEKETGTDDEAREDKRGNNGKREENAEISQKTTSQNEPGEAQKKKSDIDTFKKDIFPYLSEPTTELEKENNKYLEEHLDQATEDYYRQLETEYGEKLNNVISADVGKKVFPGYTAAKAQECHKAGSSLARYLFDLKIKDNAGTRNNTFLMTSGGSGVGKSSSFRIVGVKLKDYALVYDTNLTGFGASADKIQLGVDLGYDIDIYYVQRDPIVAFREGVIPRVKKEQRIITVETHISTHSKAFSVLEQLKERFGDNINVRYIDNTGEYGSAQMVDFDNLPKFEYDEDILRTQLLKETDDALKQEKITAEQADAIKNGGFISGGKETKGRQKSEGVHGGISKRGLEGEGETGSGEKREVKNKGGYAGADIGVFADGTPIKTGGAKDILPIQLPELLELTKELQTEVGLNKRLRSARGVFKGERGIQLKPEIFEDTGQASKTLAHEIGHLIDWLPDKTMKRGNILGRVFVLRNFIKTTFGSNDTLFGNKEGAFPDDIKKEIRNRMTKNVLQKYNIPFGEWVSGKLDKDFRKTVSEEIRKTTRQEIDKDIKKNGFISKKEIFNELYALSKYWRPFEEKESTPSFISYRKSAPELYADALSVFLNSPGLLEEKAPIFYKNFLENLENKPQVFEAFFTLQEELSKGESVLTGKRRERVRGMFGKSNMKAVEVQRILEAQRKEERSVGATWSNIKREISSIHSDFEALQRKKERQGIKTDPNDNPVYYLRERNYLGGKVKSMVEKNFVPLLDELNEAGMTQAQLGEILFYERILKGDRGKVANPGGYQPEFVEEMLGESINPNEKEIKENENTLKAELGEERFAKLQDISNRFRSALKNIFTEGYEAGLYSDDIMELVKSNDFYVPFKGYKYIGEKSRFSVKHQKGTLGDIENPVNTAIDKAISIVRAKEYNIVKTKAIEDMKQYDIDHILKAKTRFVNNRQEVVESKDKNYGTVTLLKNGKVEGYYVDRYMADSINNSTIDQIFFGIKTLKIMNSAYFRPVFIALNTSFQAKNFIRDFLRTWKNTPDMSMYKLLSLYKNGEILKAASARGFGKKSELISEMEEQGILSLTYNDYFASENDEDAQNKLIMSKLGIDMGKPTPKGIRKIYRPITTLFDTIGNIGGTIESIPKVAMYYNFRGEEAGPKLSMDEKDFIRRYVGSPDFLDKGSWTKSTNEVLLFSNAMIQGNRSDWDLNIKGKTPKEVFRSGYMWKQIVSNIIPKMMALAAVQGIFGQFIKELFDEATEYDKANYTIIPLGKDQNKKAVYLRLPQDETSRFLGAMIWKAGKLAQGGGVESLQDILSYAGGQMPLVTPSIGVVTDIAKFFTGKNIYDSYRQQTIFTDTEMAAGLGYKDAKFIKYLWNSYGGSSFMKLTTRDNGTKSGTEKVISIPVLGNTLGAFIKITDYGKQEGMSKTVSEVTKERAIKTLEDKRVVSKYAEQAKDISGVFALRKMERELVKEVLGHYPAKGEDEESRAKSLITKFKTARKLSLGNDYIDNLVYAGSNEEKKAYLREYESSMSKEDFKKLMDIVKEENVVSENVWRNYK